MGDREKLMAQQYRERERQRQTAMAKERQAQRLEEIRQQIVGGAKGGHAIIPEGTYQQAQRSNVWSSYFSDKTITVAEPTLTTEQALTMEQLRKAMESMKSAGLSVEEAVERVKKLSDLYKDNGHKKKCQFDYEAPQDRPCSCQPPTMWGHILMWYCDCCQRPESPVRFGLCDMCRAHEYAPMEQVRMDHEVEDA